MPVIVACPSCSGKLRVSDELRGERVRCPGCGHTFDTAPMADPRDLPLQLSLDEPSSKPRPASSSGPRGLVGAVELNPSPDDGQPAPPRAPQSPPAESPRRNENPDDLKECPECGKSLHRDSTRCYNCGHRFDGRRLDWDMPDIRYRGPRRDAEPDRGAIVLVLGILSLASLTISCAPIGLILGLISWIMGQSDLRKMKRGVMDTNGQGMTQAGWICGIIGVILNGLLTLFCVGVIGFAWYQDNNRPLPTTPVRPAPIQRPRPPMKPMPQKPPGGQNF
jgi:predicted Zn finger-like uncharacterized protein